MGCGAGNTLLKFHHADVDVASVEMPAVDAWTVGLRASHRRTVNQCWSRLHRNADSRWGSRHALPAAWDVAGTQVRFHTSSALVRT